jgi:hypothetical protein
LSNWRWSVQNGREDRSFEQAIAAELAAGRRTRETAYNARPHAYLERGFYAEQLAPFFLRFKRDNILILRFEDIATTPVETSSQFDRFLGIDVSKHDPVELGRVNVSEDAPGSALSEKLLNQLNEFFAGPNRDLARILGASGSFWDDKTPANIAV